MPVETTPYLDNIFSEAVKLNASDVHLTVGIPPVLRINGNLTMMPNAPAVDQAVMLKDIEGKIKPEVYQIFVTRHDIDFSFALPTGDRFRISLYWKLGKPALAARPIPSHIPSLEELDVPEAVYDFINIQNGIVLVTGPTGAGKSTLLASMIHKINETQSKHVITLEDPIEFIYQPVKSLISQRELGTDFAAFSDGLKHVFRQDPDIVLIGEMRDPETIITALTLAETGHLVFATLHTNDAVSTVERIINSFPGDIQHQVRLQLSLVLRGVVAQILLPTVDERLVAAREIMINNTAVSNTIREGKTEQLQNIILTSAAEKMVDLDNDLLSLMNSGIISHETALEFARSKNKFGGKK